MKFQQFIVFILYSEPNSCPTLQGMLRQHITSLYQKQCRIEEVGIWSGFTERKLFARQWVYQMGLPADATEHVQELVNVMPNC